MASSGSGGDFDLELVDERPGLIVFRAAGRGAAALFAGEAGGHRWQRVPPTEKRGRVHSSTITVAVLPEVAPAAVEVRAADLEWTLCRASGSGGQHLQKTDSAVQLTHRPTGLRVRCESERSQLFNRERALAILRARLVALAAERVADARARDRRAQIGRGERADKRRTVRCQDGTVVDHLDGRTWRLRDYERGSW
ncbi:MAG: PCRF domain-containing protein [Kofleriaceae bacterium]|nr:PCRF domain-containing protein [Myxococcales bacterium]MCB9575135.1 PCRF domain-containing protein [Kofleriaceae bacterium]